MPHFCIASSMQPLMAFDAFMSDRVTRTNTETDMEVFVMGANGERPRRITHNSVYEQSPVSSADGRRLALTRCTEYPPATSG